MVYLANSVSFRLLERWILILILEAKLCYYLCLILFDIFFTAIEIICLRFYSIHRRASKSNQIEQFFLW
jgi:hypothetical protein